MGGQEIRYVTATSLNSLQYPEWRPPLLCFSSDLTARHFFPGRVAKARVEEGAACRGGLARPLGPAFSAVQVLFD